MGLRARAGIPLALALGFLCEWSPAAAEKPSADETAVSAAATAFALDLYAQLAKQEKSNFFFAPGGIHAALAMTCAGARGQTAAQMAKTLRWTLDPGKLHPAYLHVLAGINTPEKPKAWGDRGPIYELVTANALFVQKTFPFRPEFLALNKECYGATLAEVDFGRKEDAARAMNDWVAEKTRGKVRNVVAPEALPELTRLVLANTVYFRSDWAYKFHKNMTKDGPFRTADGRTVQVPLMFQHEDFRYLEQPDFQALQLPYVMGHLAMVVLLPRKADGLAALEQSLTVESLQAILKAMQVADVNVTLPRFRIESMFSLTKVLAALGMQDAFDTLQADFTGLSEQRGLFLEMALHKSFVSVDEDGTEAAGVTFVFNEEREHEPPKTFVADHPFLFLIRHKESGMVLFMGRLTEPGSKP